MYRLIVVEDESKIRDGIVNLFPWEKAGFQVVGSFSNGKQALNYVALNPVDVVLTDIKMPIMDGIELAARLENNEKVKVVFLSGYQDFEFLHKAILHGVKDYLVKPVKYDELLVCFGRIKSALDEKNRVMPEERSFSYYEQIVKNVIDYINNNIKDATLEKAAMVVNLSPNYLSRILKEKSGRSFTDYLVERRMKRAAELLKEIGYKHYEIAYQVGFDNPKNFTRAFKQYYHMTPREYRDKMPGGIRNDD